ncbi:DUF72 domain-containing protein [Pseudomonas sp. RL]|uniref:DUF72 domain-containing protein n=1 Tax=Pseudomonas sp. RL TaxID=1452718 RepID=UPI000485461D|nr:DUF72 domain-containing protein [Pseudomonas sp. RL]
MSEIRIGISGWRYAPWRGDFYPEGLAQKNELHYASRTVGSIEINGSFYALQTPERYAGWYADTPEGFVFSVKAPRFITHVRRLRDVETPVANFFASGVLRLEDKLGPMLWQFPPSFRFDAGQFEHFLDLLPQDAEAARACAMKCDSTLRRKGSLEFTREGPLRHAVEIRHRSFVVPAFVELLSRYRVALVVADTAGKWPYQEDVTSDFLYLRLHGDEELYASGYSDEALDRWAARIRLWTHGDQPEDAHLIDPHRAVERQPRDAYCYFDNDIKVRAPYDARALLERLGLADRLEYAPGQLEARS